MFAVAGGGFWVEIVLPPPACFQEITMKININEKAKVKLSKEGKEFIAQKRWYVVETDERGYSEWTLWSLMTTFGAMMGPGAKPFEDGNIEVSISGPLGDMASLIADVCRKPF